MHRNILTVNQVKLLPLVKEFSRDYYLVGGTADVATTPFSS